MATDRESIFTRLRSILRNGAGVLRIDDDTPGRTCLEGKPGPASLRAWGGKVRKATIPVAWVEVGKSTVSFHLMALDGNAQLLSGMSKELKARMGGKTCFNFRTYDEKLFEELEQLAASGIAAFTRAGYVTGDPR